MVVQNFAAEAEVCRGLGFSFGMWAPMLISGVSSVTLHFSFFRRVILFFAGLVFRQVLWTFGSLVLEALRLKRILPQEAKRQRLLGFKVWT